MVRHSSHPIRGRSPQSVKTRWWGRRCALLTCGLLGVALGGSRAAAQIALPEIDPSFQVRVTADEVAKERRGAYDVLAFSGHCQLTQGSLTAGAKEIVLWIERSLPEEPNQPGKILCYLDGDARLDWNDGQSLRDHRWMGRLYSLYPVQYEAQREVRRFDIPHLDWSRALACRRCATGSVHSATRPGGPGQSSTSSTDLAVADSAESSAATWQPEYRWPDCAAPQRGPAHPGRHPLGSTGRGVEFHGESAAQHRASDSRGWPRPLPQCDSASGGGRNCAVSYHGSAVGTSSAAEQSLWSEERPILSAERQFAD